MSPLKEITSRGRRDDAQRPWPRFVVAPDAWRLAGSRLAEGRVSLLGLWGDDDAVHMALLQDEPVDVAVITVDCVEGGFPSIGALHPPAIRLERALQDLYGFKADGLPDSRPWLDHGRWDLQHPLGERATASSAPPPYRFLPVEGEGLHQIPVGPVHAGIIEPGHFRFAVNGETVVRLEQKLGYVHKGIDGLMIGTEIDHAARLAGRVSGDSTVAYALAFAHAVEAALDIKIPPRAAWLRALMAELERVANHLGDFGAICNDASFSMMLAQCGMLRERTLRASDAAFGHRLMMDRVVPGGVAADLGTDGAKQVSTLLSDIRRLFPKLTELYDSTASLQDRTVTTGLLKPELARQFAAGGFVGRASGRAFDARRAFACSPYQELKFDVPVRKEGDVDARVWIRIHEIEQSLALIEQILAGLPAGLVRNPLASGMSDTREGIGFTESFRGDILAWVRIDLDGRVVRAHLRDPSWFQWPLLEAAVENNIVADFPLCNKSFNCSYSGHDV
ncbi:MAG: NADH-quinone oxidoreductase subunit C [Pseudorhodoplanes sp.]|nr:NADH-quinone oxidoreductase subunit C [Pseudorhodoplanes sp.]